MKLFCVDGSKLEGVGRAGQFSEPLTAYLQRHGHEVHVGPFSAYRAREADVVWTEWCGDDAFEAADSGLCKKLIVRMRGYEMLVGEILFKMPWESVSALVYESQFMQNYMRQRVQPLPVREEVLATGIDLKRFPFRARQPRQRGARLGMVGRSNDLKGWQLAVELAKQRRDLEIHAAPSGVDRNPRLMRYLEYARPENFHLHPGPSDIAAWFEAVDVDYLLSASIWETLGYTIIEAMACGIKPLIHDRLDARELWPKDLIWDSFSRIEDLLVMPYESAQYRALVEESFDAEKQSRRFLDLVENLPELPPSRDRVRLSALFDLAAHAINEGADEAEELVEHFRKKTAPRGPLSEERAALATALADLNLRDEYEFATGSQMMTRDVAELWALRALADGPRVEPLCILGEVAAERGDVEEAVRWYDLANALPDDPPRLGPHELGDAAVERATELQGLIQPPTFTRCARPPRYHFIVPAWNAEGWIGGCIQSILSQAQHDRIAVVFIDDASTDYTFEVPKSPLVRVFRNNTRMGALYSSVVGIDACGAGPEDVIAIVDGDDWLQHNNVIETLDRYYMSGAWATYGGYRNSDGSPTISRPYPKKVIEANAYRRHPYLAGGFKTYKAALFQKILREDFQLGGEWIRVACDLAQMIPILELAGHRAMFVSEHIYTYNVGNPANLFKVAAEERMRVRDAIMARPPYTRLDFLTPPAARP